MESILALICTAVVLYAGYCVVSGKIKFGGRTIKEILGL